MTDDVIVRVKFQGDVADLPVQRFSSELTAVDQKVGGLDLSFAGLGKVIVGAFSASAITATAAALGDAAAEASRFDKGVREIGTLMGGLTDGEMRRMKGELTALSVASGQAIEPLTKARYDIVSAGFSSAADSAILLEQSSHLAAAGVTEVSTTADLLTTTLNSYNLEVSSAAGVSDDLFTIVRLGKTTMGELGSSMGQVLATAGPMEVSLDELGAALATTTAMGQSTAIATTSINAAMMELSKPSKEMQAALRSVGIESDNLIKTGGGLAGALDLVKEASAASGVSVEKLVSREEALRAIFPLVGAGAESFSDNLASMKDNAGAADEAFGQMSESADFLKQQTVQSFEAAKRAVGDAVIESGLYADGLRVVKDVMDEVRLLFGDTAASAEDADTDIGKALRSVRIAAQLTMGVIGEMADTWRGFVRSVSAGIPESEYSRTVNRIAAGAKSDNVLINWYAAATAGSTAYQKSLIKESEAAATAASGSKKHKEALAETVTQTKLSTESTTSNSAAVSDSETKHTSGAVAIEKRRRAVEEARKEESDYRRALTEAQVALQGGTDRTVTLAEASDRLRQARSELNRIIMSGTTGSESLTEATRELESADRDYESRSKSLSSAMTEANEALRIGSERSLSVKDAVAASTEAYANLRALLAEFVVANNAANGSVQQTRSDEERLTIATKELTEAKKAEKDAVEAAAEAHAETGRNIVSVIDAVGNAYEAASGKSIAGLEALKTAVSLFADGETTKGLLSVAGAVGSVIGGGTGAFVSGAAAGALAGLSLGPVGAVVGGLIGGISSALGADSAAKEQRDSARAEGYDALLDMALSGSGVARDLLSSAGWTYDAVSSYRTSSAIAGKAAGRRLLEDRGTEGVDALVQYVAVIDTMTQTIEAVSKSSIAVQLDSIAAKYDYMITISGDLALAEEARIKETSYALFGVSVDSLTSAFEDAMSAVSVDAGMASLSATIEDSLNASLRAITISRTLEASMEVFVDPIISQMTATLMQGGELTADMLAGLSSGVAQFRDAILPVYKDLYTLFDEVNLLPVDAEGSLSGLAVTETGSVVSTLTDVSAAVDTSATALADVSVALGAASDLLSGTVDTITTVASSIDVQGSEIGLLRSELVSLREVLLVALDLQAEIKVRQGGFFDNFERVIVDGYALRTREMQDA